MITFLTDFGTADYFVPAVKGIIYSISPQTTIIDLSHDIPAQDIRFAAFTLGACYQDFPAGTIHLGVVDPGVGSTRRPLIVVTENHFFVGPDNGLFSYVYAREKSIQVFHACLPDFFRPTISPTFHGRDVFAPLAAWLSQGVSPKSLGEEISDFVRLEISSPQLIENSVLGEIIHIDRFGNCITNLTLEEFDLKNEKTGSRFFIKDLEVDQLGTYFAQAQLTGNLFAYLGSAGYWEVAMWKDSAALRMKIERGTPVKILRD